MRGAGLLTVLLSACLLPACRHDGATRRSLPLRPFHVENVAVETQCGTFEVFEDRARGAGRKLSLSIAVLPALSGHPAADPLFVLAGGPGQAATKVIPAVLPAFDRIRRDRDLVFVDQRGTGRSNPLKCPRRESLTLEERLGTEPNEAELRACLAAYDADPRFYTTPIAMDDLDDVRAALGYDRIDLWGGSYGTRAALVYLRQHGEHVRTVTLDGVAPFGLKIPVSMAKDGQRALDAMFADCAADAACRTAFPDLRARSEALVASLRAHPASVTVAHPLTGAPTGLTIEARHVAGVIRSMLYVPELTSLVPYTLDRATKGDYAPFVAEAWALGASFDIAAGMFLSVVCAEDVPFVTPAEIEEAGKTTFLGIDYVKETMDACKVWPHVPVPASYRAPVHADVPVLILSGELDPVTPPPYGDEAKRDLPSSEHRIVTGVGHGTTRAGCVGGVIADFIAAGSARGLDPPCLRTKRRPPFSVSFAGPKP